MKKTTVEEFDKDGNITKRTVTEEDNDVKDLAQPIRPIVIPPYQPPPGDRPWRRPEPYFPDGRKYVCRNTTQILAGDRRYTVLSEPLVPR